MAERRDIGHDLTEKELKALEKRISSVYGEAAKELQGTIDDYFAKFEKRDAEMKKLIGTVQNGKEWTESDYKQWRLAQIGRGKRFEALRDKVAERMTKANQTAVSYVNDATPGIYSLNRNYAAYTIEQIAGDVGFTLWDEQTVKRLIVEQPDAMPYYPQKRAVQRGIDLAWGKKQITASVTSSILQGKSIKGMADDLQTRIPTMNRDSAIRTARTAVTGAQNAGRIDSYTSAEKMGIKLKKEWLATLDGRTRHSHAMLDGEQIDSNKKFSNGCMFPGDPNGPSWEVYNCRCTLISAVDGVCTSDAQKRAVNPITGEWGLIENQTYSQWAKWKIDDNKTGDTVGEKEDLNSCRKVWGKADGQIYRAAEQSKVEVFAEGRERLPDKTYGPLERKVFAEFDVPENDNPDLLIATGLPDKAPFGWYDSTPNYILSNGRVALNKSAKNNNTRYKIQSMVENEIYALSGVRKEGHFYRAIGSDKEIDYIKKGTIRKSVNHMTGETEDGLSVWEIPKYAGKIVEITGEVISTGSDGEPILDISTVKFVRFVDNLSELREKGIDAFTKKYGWTDKQIEQALHGGYKLNR